MGKGAATRDQPGASALAEFRRAQRSAARRRLTTAAFAVVALALVVLGLAGGGRALLLAAVVMAVLAWRWRPPPDPDRWRRGAEGEQATARDLARLPSRFVVLHDRSHPGGRGNIDHLVVGPSGVWVIDSKVRRARLRIRRGQVWAGDHLIDVAPVAAQAARIEEALGVPVAPVMAVHGAGLRRRGKVVDGVRVVPAHQLTARLRRRRRLSRSDVAVLAGRADRFLPPRSRQSSVEAHRLRRCSSGRRQPPA